MIEIGERTFPSIADMRQYVFDILNNAPVDKPLEEMDAKVLQELFLCHPEAEKKMEGQQIQDVKVGKHPQAGARAFCIIRDDGTEETFSIKKCISAWTREKGLENAGQEKPITQKEPSPQPTQQRGAPGILNQLQRVITLYNQLGKEIEQLKNALVDASK
ncbi:DUF3223 domain-containing protein [Candidatus Poribacteria bacterium]|nr:DUF3223 domain-containing protein [Candidatus Poribacteria bacterium]MYB65692.1 DUF3223 domain-containing protein [Candidatus Poribacteria bacterium]MYF55842.1 DUF3223 domain-containing protein [Candidatus Poribacteria bacterium]MYI94595.1 DUF3223 domain-containing protein [Candidatus Poribacteria bacterium]